MAPGGYQQPLPDPGGGFGRGTGTKDSYDKNSELERLMPSYYLCMA